MCNSASHRVGQARQALVAPQGRHHVEDAGRGVRPGKRRPQGLRDGAQLKPFGVGEPARRFIERLDLPALDGLQGAAQATEQGRGVAGQQLGMTPATYARGGKGAHIVYAIVASPLGRLLAAATAAGVCFVSLGDEDGALVTTLEAEFPAADSIRRDDARVAPALEALVAYLEGETPHIALPLDVRATAFQRRVWQELEAIPWGETRSYSEIAEALGLARGQRAVGRACATNPVAIVVPCHRALREDGHLGGYRWGLERKEALLMSEALMSEAGREPD